MIGPMRIQVELVIFATKAQTYNKIIGSSVANDIEKTLTRILPS